MPETTHLDNLKINILTKAQFDSITRDPNQLYLLSDIADIVVDDILSTASLNPVQNKVITLALNNKSDSDHEHSFADITNKPTNIAGYGINDAYTKGEIDTKLSGISMNWPDITNKPTTIAGYKISDAYTKTEVDGFLTGKSDTDHTHNYAGSNTSGGAANSATKLATARTIDGVNFDGAANITHYTTCATAAGTIAKTATCTGFVLATGAKIAVKFSNANTASNPTLNINSTGAKAIQYRGSNIPANYLKNGTYEFVYDGTYYQFIGDVDTNTPIPESIKNPNAITISLNGTSQGAYDGSAAKSINITPASIGAATSDHTHSYAGSSSVGGAANSAVKLATARNIGITGLTATAASFDGSAPVNINVTGVPANLLTGTIDIARLPKGAVPYCAIVANDTARFALTTATVQNGDTVLVDSTGIMYYVVDETRLNSEAGYKPYSAGIASSVDWSGVTSKPASLAGYGIADAYTKGEIDQRFSGLSSDWPDITNKPTTIAGYGITNAYTKTEVDGFLSGKSDTGHGHSFASLSSKPTSISGYGITDAYTKGEIDGFLNSKANDQHTHDWSQINSASRPTTLSGYGITDAATSDHTHSYAGSSSVGGAANSAVKLETARKINGVNFDGTADIQVSSGICVKGVVLAASGWAMDSTSGYYRYGYSNANITADKVVNVNFDLESVKFAELFGVMGTTVSAAGVVYIYSEYQPSTDMTVDVIIG